MIFLAQKKFCRPPQAAGRCGNLRWGIMRTISLIIRHDIEQLQSQSLVGEVSFAHPPLARENVVLKVHKKRKQRREN